MLQCALHLTSSLYLQIDYCISAHALHGVEFQIPLEISGIEPRNWQTVAKTSLGGGERVAEFNFLYVMLCITSAWTKKGLKWSPGIDIDLLLCACVYQWDCSWLQAWCGGSGVHVVKQPVYLPQRNSSSSVTDLKTHCGKDEVKEKRTYTDRKLKKTQILLKWFSVWVSTGVWLTFMERSSLPRVTFAFTGGNPSVLFSWSSTVALIEFYKHHKIS